MKGFTLLEVMIALAVVAIALVTLLGLGSRSITANGRVQNITQATLLAQEKMAEVETLRRATGENYQDENGTFPAPFDRYRWRTSFGETPIASVRMVTVTVAWGDENKNEAVDLTSFLFHQGG